MASGKWSGGRRAGEGPSGGATRLSQLRQVGQEKGGSRWPVGSFVEEGRMWAGPCRWEWCVPGGRVYFFISKSQKWDMSGVQTTCPRTGGACGEVRRQVETG